MSVQYYGDIVQASAQDFPVESARHKWFRLVPFGKKSVITASGHQFEIDGPGPVVLPQDPTAVLVNFEHDRDQDNGHLDMLQEREDGIYGRYLAASTPAGDQALDDIATGRRTGVSVELEAPVIRAGKLLRGFLSHTAIVKVPSFQDSRVLAAAADTGDVTEDLEEIAKNLNTVISKLKPAEDPKPDEEPNEDPDKDKEKTPVPNPVTAAAAAAAAASTVKASAASPLDALAAAQATLAGIGSATVKAAALDQITQGDVFDKVNAPDYAGELWKGRRYAGRYLDLLLNAPMTSQSVIGWRWVNGKTPQVAKWSPPSSGSPATMNDIPTNEVRAEQVTHTGFRIAGGNAVDRIHQDLPSAEWWASYNQESTDDYARKLDAEVIAHITKAANVTGLELETDMPTERMILEAMGDLVSFADPDYILLGWDRFVEMALAKKFDQSHAMASTDAKIMLSGGNFTTSYMGVPVKAAPRADTAQAKRILVGCKAANELRSLPGGPIRVEAQTISKGLIEHGVFGYHILRDVDKRGVLDVTNAAPVGG